MRFHRWFAVAALALSTASARAQQKPAPPPVAPVRPVTDDYFGIKIDDPYRYMENLADPQVLGWIKAQADDARATLDRIPGRPQLLADIEKYVNAAPAGVGSVQRLAGDKYFFLKTLASANVAKLYFRQGLDGPDRLLIDTDQFAGPNGAPAAINSYHASPDGKLVACAVSQGGSEIGQLRVFDVNSGKEIGTPIERIWGGNIHWRPDSTAFFYHQLQKLEPGASRLELEQRSKAYLHVIGQPTDRDAAVLGIGLSPRVEVSPLDEPGIDTNIGSDYVVGTLWHGVQQEITLYTAPLASVGGDIPWVKLCDVQDDVTDFQIQGNDIFLLTHADAPRFKVMRTSLAHPDIAHAACVVPESAAVLHELTSGADALYVTELDGGIVRVLRVPWGQAAVPMPTPYDGNVAVYGGDPRVPGVVFTLVTWTKGPRIFQYDPQRNASVPTDLQPAGPYDAPADLISQEVNVTSYDGAQVPLSIIMRKDLKRDGTNPTELDAYGAYGFTIDPSFSLANLAWFNRGGIVAIAHVRGGGERGEQWYQGGYKLTKPNTWRDVIAAAQYLIDQKFTSPRQLSIAGGSAGGITMGRSITERPDLFTAAMVRSGALNAIRQENSPNGVVNVEEFGSVATQEGFEDLWAMDAYQHVRPGVAYPGVMLATGMNDPRVSPWESAKMAARLQADTTSGKPILLRIDYAGGHGVGASKRQSEELAADKMAFFLWQSGVSGYQPGH